MTILKQTTEAEIKKVISSNYDAVYDLLLKALNPADFIFAELKLGEQEFIWQHEGEGWYSYADANKASRSKIISALTERKGRIRATLESKHLMADKIDQVFATPGNEYYFFRIDELTAELEVLITGWGFLRPVRLKEPDEGHIDIDTMIKEVQDRLKATMPPIDPPVDTDSSTQTGNVPVVDSDSVTDTESIGVTNPDAEATQGETPKEQSTLMANMLLIVGFILLSVVVYIIIMYMSLPSCKLPFSIFYWMSVLAFYLTAYDSHRQACGKPELAQVVTWIPAILCGSFGTMMAMGLFNHKSSNRILLIVCSVLLFMQLTIVSWLIIFQPLA